MFVNMPYSASALAESEVARSEVLSVCVCVFSFLDTAFFLPTA